MSEFLTPDEQRGIIFKHLGIEREPWLEAKRQADRNDRLSAALNEKEAEHMERLNDLLDAYIELDLLGEFVILEGAEDESFAA